MKRCLLNGEKAIIFTQDSLCEKDVTFLRNSFFFLLIKNREKDSWIINSCEDKPVHVLLALEELGKIRELAIRLVDGALHEHGEREAHVPQSARRAVRRLGWLGLAQRLRGQPGHNQPSLKFLRQKGKRLRKLFSSSSFTFLSNSETAAIVGKYVSKINEQKQSHFTFA